MIFLIFRSLANRGHRIGAARQALLLTRLVDGDNGEVIDPILVVQIVVSSEGCGPIGQFLQ